MELKYTVALYACAAIALAFIIVSFVRFRRRKKFKGGTKAAEADYIKEIPYFRRKMRIYKVLKFFLSTVIIANLLISGFLMAMPYKTEVNEIKNMNRDIILCMDISTTVDHLNFELVGKLKEVVENLNGERFGIVIFNTSPLYLCPLTTDYEQVINELDIIEEALDLRYDYYNGSGSYSNRLVELDEYISAGTLVGNEERGSSIIGDGLAAAALDFTNIEEDPDRSRIIIFSTDNDLQGDEIITLPEAGQLCVDRGITVYGIGTEQMYPSDKAMMRDAVEMTGGEFYYGEDSRVVSNIIDNIQEHVASLDTIEYEISETVTPEIPFIILLISMACMILLQWLCKV
ncbi:MAG: hypothetical protein K6A37_05930 [Saccharofermentans sp.]|nr:hypothetical protein [Clostridiales bacterium]MCR5048481.1 hypothetical protein [Saccharofermentans sp.]